MNTKNYFKMFIKDLFLPILSALFFIYINFLHIKCIVDVNVYGPYGMLSMLSASMDSSVLCFVFFMFISYYFTDKVNKSSMLECAEVTRGGALGVYLRQLAVLTALNLLFTASYFIYNMYAYFGWNIDHAEVLGHILMCLFIYIFMVSFIAMLLGLLLSLCFKRFGAYVVMIAVILLTSPFTEYFIGMNSSIFYVYEFFCLYPRGTEFFADNFLGYSLLPDRVSAPFFFAALIFAFIALKLLKGKSRLKYSAIALSGVICVVSLAVYFSPGTPTLSGRHPDAFYIGDSLYYYNNKDNLKIEMGEFSISKYEMDLAVKNELSAKVTMYVDNSSLEAYKFTLYHGYRINRAEDQEGASLDFTQDGDYVEVKRGASPVSTVTLYYSGYGTSYYTNAQGIFLMGTIPFYPRSGYQIMYDVKTQGFYSNYHETPVEFNVKVDYAKTVYSNLDSTESNTFSGTADNIILMSGFLEEKSFDGINVVYPYLDNEQYTDERISTDIAVFFDSRPDDRPIKRIFTLPPFYLGKYAKCLYFSDGTLVCSQIISLPIIYPSSMVLDVKRNLMLVYNSYIHNHSDFENRLKYEKEVYTVDEPGLAMLLQNAVEQIGEEKVLEAVDEYLYNYSDTRESKEFFADLTKEG